MANTTAELLWIKTLLRDIGIFLANAPVLWCDNLSAIYLTASLIFHARTKHVEVDFHFVHERVARKELGVRFISSEDQTADILTKGLSSMRFQALRHKLTVVSPPLNLRGNVGDKML